jgi:hypothetical protein
LKTGISPPFSVFYLLTSTSCSVLRSQGGVFHGFAKARVFFGKVSTYLDNHVAIERIFNGGDRVAVIGRTHGTTKDTGNPFNVPLMHLLEFKDKLAFAWAIVIDVLMMQGAVATIDWADSFRHEV